MRNVFEYYKEDDHLAHWGIKGQKWGIRRFQNPDGTLTEAGKQRYGKALDDSYKKIINEYAKEKKKVARTGKVSSFNKKINNASHEYSKLRKEIYESSKDCSTIINKVRSIRERFLDESSSNKNREKAFNELCDLSLEFKAAANKVYSEMLPNNSDLVNLSTDKAVYDDFWNYAFKDWD